MNNESIESIESIEPIESTATNEVCQVCYNNNNTLFSHVLCKTCFNKLETKECPVCKYVLKKHVDMLDILMEELNGGCVFELIKQKKADQLEEWLIQRPEDIRLTKALGQTLLHEACICASEDCVKLLIKYGADVRATNAMGLTPLHLACGNKNVEIVCALINAGADKYAKTSANNTPLDHAKMWDTDNIFASYLC